MTQFPSFFAVFPGQGSQHVGMGKDLCENFKAARETFEEASDAISIDLKKLCFEGPDSDLTRTENTQPCLLTTSVAAFRAAQKELHFLPTASAGHSLGEYSALVANGSIELATAVRWVRERGAAMQKAVPQGEGSMAAVIGLEDAVVTKLCQKATELARSERPTGTSASLSVEAIVEPANYNAPGQVVVAGSTDGIEKVLNLLKNDPEFTGGKGIPLQVSAPFHCRLMQPARKRMAELFSQSAAPKKPLFPYVPNRTARLTDEPGVIFELLIEQIDHPVLWKQSVQGILETSSIERLVEFGPGKVLCGLAKRISSTLGKPCRFTSVGDSVSLKGLETFLSQG